VQRAPWRCGVVIVVAAMRQAALQRLSPALQNPCVHVQLPFSPCICQPPRHLVPTPVAHILQALGEVKHGFPHPWALEVG
jgi:hypothetical protein